jgi:uncharacterized protein (TIGR03663 family)
VSGIDHFLTQNWRFGVVGILLIGAVLRLYDLNLKPLHHDEGVNGNFLVRLVREGVYRYDPENYHGPTLYYFSAVIPRLTKLLFGASASETYGLTTFNIRLVTAVFGLATVGLVFFLRRRLGTMATLVAGLMLAISPGAVYLSRYFIHETLFVFFTLGIVVAIVIAYERRNASYLIAAAASASLLFATKETAMISVGVLIIALVLTLFYARMNRRAFAQATANKRGQWSKSPGWWESWTAELGGQKSVLMSLGLALIGFIVIYVLFYSSFFTNSKGLYASFQTFAIWAKTGKVAHPHPPETYLIWLLREESPLLFLGAIGAGITVLKPRNSFALFSAQWAFGLIAAYSLISYKTPWLLLSFIVPLALIAGYAIQAIYEMDRGEVRLVLAILFAAIGLATYQTIDLNFFNYDNDQRVYVYAHTKRSTLDLVDQINQIAKEESEGQTGITVVSPDYWPLPWYLRNYSRVGYYARMAATVEPIIIANEIQRPEVEATFGELYEQVRSKAEDGSFELRPGVKLLLYRRR